MKPSTKSPIKLLMCKIRNQGWCELSLQEVSEIVQAGFISSSEDAVKALQQTAENKGWRICPKSQSVIIYAQMLKAA